MADALELTQSQYSKLEKGADITLHQLSIIADTLKLRVEDIICFDDELLLNLIKQQGMKGSNSSTQILANEKKIYEEYIQALKNEVQSLKGIIDKLLNKK